jgi:hypothetical protein
VVFGAGLATGNEGQLLVLCAHHAAVDVHSWFILLQDLDTLLRSPAPASLAAPGVGYLDWARYLHRKVQEEPFLEDVDHWRRVLAVPEPRFPAPDVRPGGSVERLVGAVPAATIGRLSELGWLWCGADLQALLLTALAASLGPWSAGPACRIELEGHGRSTWADQPEIAGTVGWFTTLYPVALPTRRQPWESRLMAVKEALAAVPAGGASYGLLAHRARRLTAAATGLRFNYISRAMEPAFDAFSIDRELSGLVRGSNPLDCAVNLDLANGADGLRICMDYDSRRIGSSGARALLAAYRRSLDELWGFLAKQTTARPSIWGFDAVHLSNEDLIGLFGTIGLPGGRGMTRHEQP